MEQLLIYAALFCLEYKIKPGEIDMELRIYQNDEILYHNPTAEDIVPVMDKIVHLNKIIEIIIVSTSAITNEHQTPVIPNIPLSM